MLVASNDEFVKWNFLDLDVLYLLLKKLYALKVDQLKNEIIPRFQYFPIIFAFLNVSRHPVRKLNFEELISGICANFILNITSFVYTYYYS